MAESGVFYYIFISGILVSSIQIADLILLDRHKKSIQRAVSNLDNLIQRLRIPSTPEILSSDAMRIAISSILSVLLLWTAYGFAHDFVTEFILFLKERDIGAIGAFLSYVVFLYLGLMFVIHGGGHRFCSFLMENVLDSRNLLIFFLRFGLMSITLATTILMLVLVLIAVMFMAAQVMSSDMGFHSAEEGASLLGVELDPLVVYSYLMNFAAWFSLFATPFLIYFSASYVILLPIAMLLFANIVLSTLLEITKGLISRIAGYSQGPVAAVVIILTFVSGIFAFSFDKAA